MGEKAEGSESYLSIWVIHPSHKGAYMQGGILSESTQSLLMESANFFESTPSGIITVSNKDILNISNKSSNFVKMYESFEFSDKSKIFFNESANNLIIVDPVAKQKYAVPVDVYMKDKVKNLIRKL